ncbi:hypothetical protein SJI19_00025 [Acerihabitans sp. TG2]|uniref:hypothetical protein n=1 Tax=Acerihabitans sp. TG2 TaxID=3096008 RepID=UPI002B22AA21|nr:hypothetical protein [Acerihabitans sp. TG2]MEA9388954.1 hypothetical protein [Acerihabitans sp. TG2]
MTDEINNSKQRRMLKLASEETNDDRLEHNRNVILKNISSADVGEFKFWLYKGKRENTLPVDIGIEDAVSFFLAEKNPQPT